MAVSQFTRFPLLLTLAVLLFSFDAQASVIPYWGDKSCSDIDDCNHTPFPAIFARFVNPVTSASTLEAIWMTAVFGQIYFLDHETEAYRLDTGCLTCDVYKGAFTLSNMDSGNEWYHPADVFTPFGFEMGSEVDDLTAAFDGFGLRLIDSIYWEAVDRAATMTMVGDGTWLFYDEGEGTETRGTWSYVRDGHGNNIEVPEPSSFWLVVVALLTLHPLSRSQWANRPARYNQGSKRNRV